MAIDPRIALGVQPVQQQQNMLGQYAQIMGIKAAQQDMQSNEALRNFYAQGGDVSTPEGRRQLMAQTGAIGSKIIGQQSEIAARDVKTQADSLKTIKENVGMVGSPAEMVEFLKGAYSTPGGALLAKLVPYDKAITSIPTDPKAFADYKRNLGLTSDKLFNSADALLSAQVSREGHGVQIRGQNITQQNNEYNQRNPTQHFFTADDGTLMGTSTRGGPAAPVPMAGSSAPPPNITIGGGGVAPITGGPAPMGGVSSIMNPSSVNAFSPNSTNALLNPPQPTTGVKYAKVRQPTAPITNVNTFVPASETAQAEFMKGTRTTFDQLKQAPTVLDNIEKAKALIPTAKGFMGTGGETMLEAAKFLNNRLGTSIDLAGVKSAEELNTRAFMGILDNLKKLDAQPSQSQQAALKQALGSLNTDPSAMSAVLDVFGDIVRSKVDIYNQEVKGAEERGIKFPYNPVIKLQERTPANTGDIATNAGVAKVIKSNAEYNALPSGATFTAPDGTIRRKP
jgi:hypothetical protein